MAGCRLPASCPLSPRDLFGSGQRPPVQVVTLLGDEELTICTAGRSDLPYIERTQRKLCHALGFVPRSAMRQRRARGDYWIVEIGGQKAGYLLIGGGVRAYTRLSQIGVQPDLWRMGIGSAALAELKRHATLYPHPRIIADVATDLPMNEVAAATGALPISSRCRVSVRGRRTTRWLWPSLVDQ